MLDDEKYRGDQDECGVPDPGQPPSVSPFIGRQDGDEKNKCFLGEDPQGKKNQREEIERLPFSLQVQMKKDQRQ